MADITELLGGLALGFSQSIQGGQERALRQELLKNQIEQNKLQAKMNEAKLKQQAMAENLGMNALQMLQQFGQGGSEGQGARPQMQEVPAPQVAPQSMGQASPAGPIQDMVRAAALQHGVDPDFALAIAKHESGFNPQATSPKGAMGIMQLMPGTANRFGVNDPYDPQQNISGGMQYLKFLGEKFRNDPALMAAGYNAGEGAVDKYGGIPPYAETQKFVKNVTGSLPERIAQQQTMGDIRQISRPQTKLISQLPIQVRTAMDLGFKQAFDLDTGFRKMKPEIKGDLEKGFVKFSDDGEMIGFIPGMGSIELKEGKDAQGNKIIVPIGKPAPGGIAPQVGGVPGGGNTIIEVAPQFRPKELSEAQTKEVAGIKKILGQFELLEGLYDPSFVGIPGKVGSIKDSLSGTGLIKGDPKRAQFNQVYGELLGAKVKERGGSAVTQVELGFIERTLPRLHHSPELFRAGINAAKMLLRASEYEILAGAATPDAMKHEQAARGLIDQYMKMKPMLEKGAGFASPEQKKPSLGLGKDQKKRLIYNPSTGMLE